MVDLKHPLETECTSQTIDILFPGHSDFVTADRLGKMQVAIENLSNAKMTIPEEELNESTPSGLSQQPNDISSQYDYARDESESEDDFEVLSDIPARPLHQQPSHTQAGTIGFEAGQSAPAKREATPFVAVGDIPKHRFHSVNFNPIRGPKLRQDPEQVDTNDSGSRDQPAILEGLESKKGAVSQKYALSTQEHNSKGEPNTESPSGQPIDAACRHCRLKDRRCTHRRRSLLSRSVVSAASSAPSSPRSEATFPKKKVKIKRDGRPYKRVPHNRSKGPSMTPNAVDYRERKEIQAQYEFRFADLIDPDIVTLVEQEGGITPLGRLFKAGVRMLERVAEEREGRTITQSTKSSANSEAMSQELVEENRKLWDQLENAKKLKEALQDLLRV